MPFFKRKQKKMLPAKKSWQRRNPKTYSAVPRRSGDKAALGVVRFLYWMLLIIFLGVCVYLFLFSPLLEIDTISVQGNESVSSEEIINKANQELDGKYFKYFSKRNYFIEKNSNLSNLLKNNFNRLGSVEIEKKFPRTLVIRVDERQAELVWCSAGVCYLIDQDGLAYSSANGTDEELRNNNFLTIIDDSARPVDIEKTSISPELMNYIKNINAVVRDDLKIEAGSGIHTPSIASGEIYLQTGEGWVMKLSSQISPEDTKKIIQTVFDKELDQEKRKNLEYLDLRVKNKVYYKYR
jgi:cell division septal protein FtsQ